MIAINLLGSNSLCRWSTNHGEPLLFVKHNNRFLNILDTEKKAFVLNNSIELDYKGNRSLFSEYTFNYNHFKQLFPLPLREKKNFLLLRKKELLHHGLMFAPLMEDYSHHAGVA